mgnify:CR=1 FL=1
MKQFFQKIINHFKHDQQAAARKTMLEELFNDFNKNRVDIYKINFVRGISFGLGSVIGGTVVLAVLIWLLTLLGNIIDPLGDFLDGITAMLENARK